MDSSFRAAFMLSDTCAVARSRRVPSAKLVEADEMDVNCSASVLSRVSVELHIVSSSARTYERASLFAHLHTPQRSQQASNCSPVGK